jgi:protoporphyrinogen IX oxidase
MSYEWVKVVHILAMISWMAGLFYLPRLFVYHTDEVVGSPADGTFKIMERRLLSAIMRPAAVVTLLSGLLLVHVGGYGFGERWLMAKLVGVVCLFGYHGLLESHVAKFAQGERGRTGRYFRIINEIPTVLLTWIVIWVVVKPFQ